MRTAGLRRPRAGSTGAALAGSLTLLVHATDNPLKLESRKQIYELVASYPGLHLSEIARQTELDTNHAKYHLRVLEAEGLVSSDRDGGYWRFYPVASGAADERASLQGDEREWLSLLRREVPLKVALTLLETGSIAAGELADTVDVAPSTLHYHASKMEDADFLESRKEGRSRIYELADPSRVETLIAEYQPPDPLVDGFLEGWEQMEFP